MPKIKQLSTKRLLIDKTNKSIVATTAVAAFIVVFCLVASKTLVGQVAYQNRIISAKKDALTQLQADSQAAGNLATAYNAFVSTPSNVIGGDPNGNGSQDGNNAKIVLDALPSKYDFPALVNSIQGLIGRQNLQIQSITGTDEQETEGSNTSSANPQPVAMPFQASVQGGYSAVQGLVGDFQQSIRPFQIQKLEISGNESKMTLTITAQTFYQPGINFKVTTKAVQ